MTDHVLVVEDEESYRDSLRFLFEREGFRVTLAATGKQGHRGVRARRRRRRSCST